MMITRKSPLTGTINTMSIDVTQRHLDDWEGGMLIQNAMPSHLTADEREFIMTGSLSSDWTEMFGDWDGELMDTRGVTHDKAGRKAVCSI